MPGGLPAKIENDNERRQWADVAGHCEEVVPGGFPAGPPKQSAAYMVLIIGEIASAAEAGQIAGFSLLAMTMRLVPGASLPSSWFSDYWIPLR